MGAMPCALRYSLVLEKCLQPKNPLKAERGEGCAHSRMRCLFLSMRGFFERALPPQRMNTRCSLRSLRREMTLSVNHVQPQFLCEFAMCARTVRAVLRRSTPSFAHFVRSPESGGVQPTSSLSSLKISNIEDLASNDLLTEEQRKYELRLYRFRNYIFNKKFLAKQTGKSITTAYYKLDRKYAEPYFYENFETYMNEGKDYEYSEDGFIIVKRGSFERVFNKLMEDFKDNVLSNPELLNKINELKFNNIWNEKAYGTIAKWEMDSLCFYYSGHELSEIEESKYNIVDFNSLNEEPEISDYYFYRGQQKPRFKLVRIAGTVIDKNKDHHVVTLLTTHGIVNVKFYKGQFSFYDKQISEKVEGEESTKVIEKSWFARGEKLLITGFRRGEQFIPKKYGDSIYTHSVQLITTITSEGNLILKSERANQNE